MVKTYSTCEAKAKFSEVMRLVRQEKTVWVTYRGEPIAEIRPIARRSDSLEDRLKSLEQQRILIRSSNPRRGKLAPTANRPGALERFLAERSD